MRQTLKPHPDTPCRAVSSFRVTVERQRSRIVLTYFVAGQVDDLRLSSPLAPARTHELWQHTCFEAFTRMGDGAAYREFNFSPSTAWAAYDFTGYRDGMANAAVSPPEIETHTTRGTFTLKATFEPNLGAADLRLALCAVLEDQRGGKSYWALAHPPGKPDFHHPDGFTLDLKAPTRP